MWAFECGIEDFLDESFTRWIFTQDGKNEVREQIYFEELHTNASIAVHKYGR